jgi:hypothetical protein
VWQLWAGRAGCPCRIGGIVSVKKSWVLGAFFSVLPLGGAMAADLPLKAPSNAPPPSATSPRSGFYLGGEIGLLSSSVNETSVKLGYKGTYHEMSAKHLARYVTEFAGRHNARDFDTLVQTTPLARGLEGRRLRYDDLIAGNA